MPRERHRTTASKPSATRRVRRAGRLRAQAQEGFANAVLTARGAACSWRRIGTAPACPTRACTDGSPRRRRPRPPAEHAAGFEEEETKGPWDGLRNGAADCLTGHSAKSTGEPATGTPTAGRISSFSRRFDAERFLEATALICSVANGSIPLSAGRRLPTGRTPGGRLRRSLVPNRRGYWLLLKNHVLPYFGTGSWLMTTLTSSNSLQEAEAGARPEASPEMVTVLSLIRNARSRQTLGATTRRRPRTSCAPSARLEVSMLTMDQATSLVEHTSDHYKAAMWLSFSQACVPLTLRPQSGGRRPNRKAVHLRRTWSPVPSFNGGQESMWPGQ